MFQKNWKNHSRKKESRLWLPLDIDFLYTPISEAANPIEVKSFVQLNVVVPFILARSDNSGGS